MKPLKVVIGYDPKESLAYYVLQHSIARRSSYPVEFIPLRLDVLRRAGVYNRSVDEHASTDFSLSRFLAPYLADHNGWVLFMDCDMLMLSDVHDLFKQADNTYDVMCCKHDYTPKPGDKMLGNQQHAYPRKNWSSLMLINSRPLQTRLGAKVVNNETPQFLHRMMWAADSRIGSLPLEWNWLAGEYEEKPVEQLHNIHWTLGGPWWHAYASAPYADVWYHELDHMMNESGGNYAAAYDLAAKALRRREEGERRQEQNG